MKVIPMTATRKTRHTVTRWIRSLNNQLLAAGEAISLSNGVPRS